MAQRTGIAIISMVKDESDIIEAFVRHNLAHADHLYVIDNGSEDGTLEILASLSNEGLPVTVIPWLSRQYQQAIAMNVVLRKVAAEARYEWFVPLDADEFLKPPPGKALHELLKEVPEGKTAAVPWMNFVPLTEWTGSGEEDLRGTFVGRVPIPDGHPIHQKVMIPMGLVPLGMISPGNHFFQIENQIADFLLLPMVLQHLPVRSCTQAICKVLLGSASVAIKPNRFKEEASHWDHIAAFVRERQYRLTLADLRRIAHRYPTLSARDDFFDEPGEILFFEGPAQTLRHTRGEYGLVARLDGHIRMMTDMLIKRSSGDVADME